MTVAELREELKKYPDDMEVYHADADVEGFPVHYVLANEAVINGDLQTILELN